MPLQETKQIVVFINVLCACSKSADQGHRARAEYETLLHLVIILAEKKTNIFYCKRSFSQLRYVLIGLFMQETVVQK